MSTSWPGDDEEDIVDADKRADCYRADRDDELINLMDKFVCKISLFFCHILRLGD